MFYHRSQNKIIKFWHIFKFIHDKFGIEKDCYLDHLELKGVSIDENSLSHDSDKDKLVAFLNDFGSKIAIYVSVQDIILQTIDLLHQDYEKYKPNVFKIFRLYAREDQVWLLVV